MHDFYLSLGLFLQGWASSISSAHRHSCSCISYWLTAKHCTLDRYYSSAVLMECQNQALPQLHCAHLMGSPLEEFCSRQFSAEHSCGVWSCPLVWAPSPGTAQSTHPNATILSKLCYFFIVKILHMIDFTLKGYFFNLKQLYLLWADIQP